MKTFEKILLVLVVITVMFCSKVTVKAAEIENPVDEETMEEYYSQGCTINQTTYNFTFYDNLGILHSATIGINGGYQINWDEGFSGWVSPCWATITSLKIDGVSRTLSNSYAYSASSSILSYSFYDPTGTYIVSPTLNVIFYCDEYGYDYGWYARIQ